MRKLDQRAVLLGLGAIAAIALFVGMVLKSEPGGGDKGEVTTSLEDNDGRAGNGAAKPAAPATSTTPRPAAPATIVVRAGEPVGGVAELSFDHGERARFRVTSDSAEEIHVHGYDLAKDVAAGGAVTFDFPADLEGVFEVELEQRATQIAELAVNP